MRDDYGKLRRICGRARMRTWLDSLSSRGRQLRAAHPREIGNRRAILTFGRLQDDMPGAAQPAERLGSEVGGSARGSGEGGGDDHGFVQT